MKNKTQRGRSRRYIRHRYKGRKRKIRQRDKVRIRKMKHRE